MPFPETGPEKSKKPNKMRSTITIGNPIPSNASSFTSQPTKEHTSRTHAATISTITPSPTLSVEGRKKLAAETQQPTNSIFPPVKRQSKGTLFSEDDDLDEFINLSDQTHSHRKHTTPSTSKNNTSVNNDAHETPTGFHFSPPAGPQPTTRNNTGTTIPTFSTAKVAPITQQSKANTASTANPGASTTTATTPILQPTASTQPVITTPIQSPPVNPSNAKRADTRPNPIPPASKTGGMFKEKSSVNFLAKETREAILNSIKPKQHTYQTLQEELNDINKTDNPKDKELNIYKAKKIDAQTGKLKNSNKNTTEQSKPVFTIKNKEITTTKSKSNTNEDQTKTLGVFIMMLECYKASQQNASPAYLPQITAPDVNIAGIWQKACQQVYPEFNDSIKIEIPDPQKSHTHGKSLR